MKLRRRVTTHPKLPTVYHLNNEEAAIVKKVILRFLAVIIVLLAVYFWGVAIISNIDSFWSTFSFFKKPATENAQRQLRPPAPPRLTSIPVATRSAALNIGGYADEGLTIKLFANDVEIQSLVSDKEGGFSFEDAPLAEGQNRFYVKAYDSFGQESKPSRTVVVTYKEKPPSLIVRQPFNQETFTQKESEIAIEGKTDPEVSVKVNELQMVVDDRGNFRTLYSLQEGANKLHFEAQDLAGNKTAKDLTVYYNRTF